VLARADGGDRRSVITRTPGASRPRRSSSLANGSRPGIRRSPFWSTVTASVPRPLQAVAISQATTPPPRMPRLRGAAWALVALRLIHGWA
jgi:hypothetical protein